MCVCMCVCVCVCVCTYLMELSNHILTLPSSHVEPLIEGVGRVKDVGHDVVEQCPELVEVVLWGGWVCVGVCVLMR